MCAASCMHHACMRPHARDHIIPASFRCRPGPANAPQALPLATGPESAKDGAVAGVGGAQSPDHPCDSRWPAGVPEYRCAHQPRNRDAEYGHCVAPQCMTIVATRACTRESLLGHVSGKEGRRRGGRGSVAPIVCFINNDLANPRPRRPGLRAGGPGPRVFSTQVRRRAAHGLPEQSSSFASS